MFCDKRKRSDGYEVVLAHAERYSSENIEEMIHAGAKI